MVILTYVYLQFIPSMRGKKFERQSNLDCDMDVNILEKNGRDIGECLSVSKNWNVAEGTTRRDSLISII